MIKIKPVRSSRIRQGDIFKDVELIETIQERRGILTISKIIFPLALVLTQDCDLEQDDKTRKKINSSDPGDTKGSNLILSILVAPLYNSDHLFNGTHLEDLGTITESINQKRSPGQTLRENKNPRYHYLEVEANIPIPNSIIDFKHYFSVNLEYLKKIRPTNFMGKVSELYREDISQRFAGYLSRIGLPNPRKNP